MSESNIKYRILFFHLIFFLVLWMSFSYKSDAAGKISLNRKEISLSVGRTANIKLNGASAKNVKWKSLNPAVVTVKKGKIYAKKTGKAKIEAKYQKKKYYCRVTVYQQPIDYMPAKLKQDYTVKKNTGAIVLAGSSSLEYWKSYKSAFSPYKVLNMGISGSTVSDWLKRYQTLVVRYNPKAVVVYIGGNDIGNHNTPGLGAMVGSQVCTLLDCIRGKLPKTQIFYVSIVKTNKRNNAWSQVDVSNSLVRQHCAKTTRLNYISLNHYFMKGTSPNNQYFRKDKLHPNVKGYQLWKKIVASVVKKYMKTGKVPDASGAASDTDNQNNETNGIVGDNQNTEQTNTDLTPPTPIKKEDTTEQDHSGNTGSEENQQTPPQEVSGSEGDQQTPPEEVPGGEGDQQTPPEEVPGGEGDPQTPPEEVPGGEGDPQTPPEEVPES